MHVAARGRATGQSESAEQADIFRLRYFNMNLALPCIGSCLIFALFACVKSCNSSTTPPEAWAQ